MSHFPTLKEMPVSPTSSTSPTNLSSNDSSQIIPARSLSQMQESRSLLFKSASVADSSASNLVEINSRESALILSTISDKTAEKPTSSKASASLYQVCLPSGSNTVSSVSGSLLNSRESAKQKRLVLRDYKAKVDSLEKEELRKKIFDQHQKQLQMEER